MGEPLYNQQSNLCDKDFAFLDNKDSGQATIAYFDSNQLDVVSSNGTNVLNCDHIDQILFNFNAVKLVPKLDDNDSQRETFITRGAMWCPWELVPHLIGKNLKLKQTYTIL